MKRITCSLIIAIVISLASQWTWAGESSPSSQELKALEGKKCAGTWVQPVSGKGGDAKFTVEKILNDSSGVIEYCWNCNTGGRLSSSPSKCTPGCTKRDASVVKEDGDRYKFSFSTKSGKEYIFRVKGKKAFGSLASARTEDTVEMDCREQ